MSTSDGSFQTQIASVLDALVKVAAEELTKLFDSHYLAFRSTLLVDGRTEQSATPGFFETPPSKTFQSIAVQVDGRAVYFEPSTKDRCCPIEGSSDCLKEGREKVDTPLVETNEPKDLGDTSLKEKDEKGMSCSSRYPETTNKELHTQGPAKDTCSAVPSTSITRKLRSLQTKSKNRIVARNKTNNSRPTVVKKQKQAPAPQPETMEEPAPVELQQGSVSTAKGTAYSPVSSDGVIAPLTVSLWDRLASVKDVVNEHKKETSRDQKLLLPCSVQLVNLSLVEVQGKTGRTGGGGGGSGGSSPESRKGFQTPKDLRTHQSIHTGRRLCCFTKCGNGVWRLQRVISQSNSHCCKICGKKFKRRKILRRHERFHTGEKPYRCPKCHKMFALRKSLRRHQRFHSGEKPHTCPQCGKSFRLRDNLKAHLRFHTGERPFTCSICTKSFRIYRNLTEHQRSHL